MKVHFRNTVRLYGLFIIVGLFILYSFSWADIPFQVNIQGQVTDTTGNPVSDGNYNFVFNIYTTPSGSTTSAIFTESVTLYPVQNGIFSYLLGSNAPLTLPFGTPYWLGVSVQGEPEMSPRQKIVSVGNAYKAWNSDSADIAQYASTAGSAASTDHALSADNATNATNATNADNANTAGIAYTANTAAYLSSAANIGGGILEDTLLSSNVPRLTASQMFTGVNTFGKITASDIWSVTTVQSALDSKNIWLLDTVNAPFVNATTSYALVAGSVENATTANLAIYAYTASTASTAITLISAGNILDGVLDSARLAGVYANVTSNHAYTSATAIYLGNAGNILGGSLDSSILVGNYFSATVNHSLSSGTAENLSDAANIITGKINSARLAGNYLNATTNYALTAGSVSNLFAFTASTATTLTSADNILGGTLNDARLSSNVPLLNLSNTYNFPQTITPVGYGTTGLVINGTDNALYVFGGNGGLGYPGFSSISAVGGSGGQGFDQWVNGYTNGGPGGNGNGAILIGGIGGTGGQNYEGGVGGDGGIGGTGLILIAGDGGIAGLGDGRSGNGGNGGIGLTVSGGQGSNTGDSAGLGGVGISVSGGNSPWGQADAIQATGNINLLSGQYIGNGSGLTNLPSSNLTGSISDTRLSSNVPLLNLSGQTWTGSNTTKNTWSMSTIKSALASKYIWINDTINGVPYIIGTTAFSNNAGNSGFAYTASTATTLTSASNIISGTLSDLRLSTNVPLMNSNNTFTNHNLFNSGSNYNIAEFSSNAASTDPFLFVTSTHAPRTWGLGVQRNIGAFMLYDDNTSTYPFMVEAGTPSYTMYISSSGKVGIGTTTPDDKLVVWNGNIDLNVGYTVDGVDVSEQNATWLGSTASQTLTAATFYDVVTSVSYVNGGVNVKWTPSFTQVPSATFAVILKNGDSSGHTSWIPIWTSLTSSGGTFKVDYQNASSNDSGEASTDDVTVTIHAIGK